MSDDTDKDNDIDMQPTFDDLQRVGAGNYQDLDNYIDAIGGKQNKLFRSDIEIFVHSVYNVAKELIDNNILYTDDLDILLNSMSKLNKPQYKNATAYILGYIASGGGRNITKEKIKKALGLIRFNKKDIYTVQDKSIDCAAVIRYARLWQNII
jgi:hypothetical protein